MKWKIQATAGSVLDLLANSFSKLDYLGMLALNSSINLFPYTSVFFTIYMMKFLGNCSTE